MGTTPEHQDYRCDEHEIRILPVLCANVPSHHVSPCWVCESESLCKPTITFHGGLLAPASGGECLQEVMLRQLLSTSHEDPHTERICG